MMAKDIETGFHGRNLFNKEVRKQFQGECPKTTNSENFEFMNIKVETMEYDNVSVEDIEALCEKWWMKSTEEKQMFVEKLNMSFKRKTSQNGVTDFGLTECNYF